MRQYVDVEPILRESIVTNDRRPNSEDLGQQGTQFVSTFDVPDALQESREKVL